jgi:tricorn protease-like protein
MCYKAEIDDQKRREYNLREAEYYDKRVELDFKNFSPYVSEDGDIFTEEPKGDKVVKWHLPVELDGLTGECYVQLPDDLLEIADLKEGDAVRWIDRGDGSFGLRKVDGTK